MVRLLSFFCLCLWTVPTSAESWLMRYDARWQGITFAKSDVTLTLDHSRYEIKIESKTTGLARLFAGGQARVVASGDVVDGKFTSRSYLSEGNWDGHNYRRLILFDEGGRFVSEEADWPQAWLEEEREREPVPAEMQIGPDPVSALLALTSLGDLKGRALTLRAFNSNIVFDIALNCDVEQEEFDLVMAGLQPGSAQKCGVNGELVVGRIIDSEEDEKKRLANKRKREKAKRHRRGGSRAAEAEARQNNSEDSTGAQVWLAPGKLGWPLPVKLRANSDFGTIEAFLTEMTEMTEVM